MTTITATIEDYHSELSGNALQVIPVRGKTRGAAGTWDIRCPEGTKIGSFVTTDRPYGAYLELHPCDATLGGQEYKNAIFRDALPFAGIIPALLVMG